MLGYAQCVIEVTTLHLDDIKSIAYILIPLTSERLRFFNRDRYACPSGGLKGKMAPGDAHPYLAPF